MAKARKKAPPKGRGKGKGAPKKKVGRPTKYSQTLADEFCQRIADGGSERKVCEAEDMPSRETIRQWERTNEEFSGQYARAREERGWTLAEQAVEIADTPLLGVIETDKVGASGPYTEKRRADMIEHRRLQVETRKWFASKLNPKRLSDKLLAEHSGPDGGAVPVAMAVTLPDYDKIQQMARKHADRVAG